MAWPGTEKRKTTKPAAKGTVRKTSQKKAPVKKRPAAKAPAVRVVKSTGGKYVVKIGSQVVSKPTTKAVATKAAAGIRPKVKTNPGVIEFLATLAMGSSAALDVHERLTAKQKKPRKTTKRTAKKTVRKTSQKQNAAPTKKAVRSRAKKNVGGYTDEYGFHPIRSSEDYDDVRAGEHKPFTSRSTRVGKAAKKRLGIVTQPSLFNKNTEAAAVTAYKTFHRAGLPAAIKFVDQSNRLTVQEKRELKKDLRDYHKPPTIGNPAKKRETPTVRANGMISRWRGRAQAAKELKKELLLKAKLERTAARKKKAIKRATKSNPNKAAVGKKRPTPKKSAAPQKRAVKAPAKKRSARGSTTARKRNPSGGYEAFQGRESTKVLDLSGPHNIPANTWTLGELHEIRIPGKKPIDFTHDRQGRPLREKFYLLSDNKDEGLWIAGTRGGKVAVPDLRIEEGNARSLGKASHIVYKTLKAHLDDVEPVLYEHKFGEEGGERPAFAIDRDGFGHIIGGAFTITPLGIRD